MSDEDTNITGSTGETGTGTGETGTGTGGKRSAWMAHVKKTMKANKGKPLSAVLKMAKKTYKKSKKGGAYSPMPVESSASATQTAGRRRRGSKKTRKGSRKH